jgi:NADPH-dependent glutamate synthase beta subunit-like oxidoreductase
VARTVRRLGAAATAVEWMDERFARVRPDELAEARHEGVVIRFSTTLERLEGDEGGVRAAWLRHTVQPEVTRQPRLTSQPAQSLPVTRVIIALGYRVDREVAAGVVALPLRTAEPGHAIPDRRWTASGIPTGPVRAVGTQALQRELGLAVAGSPVHSGWWARLRRRTPEPAGRFRTTWWARLWRRQAEIGFAAAPTAYASRVWVAGDALVGPSTVVGAMAQGRAAARAVLATRPSRPEAERTRPPA